MKNDIVFISHGGGPMPILGDPQHAQLVEVLKNLPNQLVEPKQIVVISAHWESDAIAITSNASPSLLFDYYGFPAESYQLTYPVKGEPELAKKIANLLSIQGFSVNLDEQRGIDHGVFIPLMLMYPKADVPVLQISLSSSLDPAEHIAIGEALASLDEPDTLFLGSGFSFHNMGAFFADSSEIRAANESFESWLADTLLNREMKTEEINQRLINWHSAPGAQFCHPREEHLLPLHVCYGIANAPADKAITIEILNKRASNFLWLKS